MVKKFEEFISEGLWSNAVERSKTNTKRIGDVTPLDDICKRMAEIAQKELKLVNTQPNKICFYEKSDESENDETYTIGFNFGEYAIEYDDISFDVVIDTTDFDKVVHEMFYALDNFQDDGFDYEMYKDPYMSSKREFNKIKKTFVKMVDMLQKL